MTSIVFSDVEKVTSIVFSFQTFFCQYRPFIKQLVLQNGGCHLFSLLAAVGIDRNSPVSMHLRERKFSTVLNLMLELIATERGKPGYTIDDGVITISTQDDLAKNVVVRVYDIRDLILPQVNRQVQVDRITRLIEHQIDPRSWKTAGGSVGALRELEGQLIVTQTPDNHRRIVGILKDLRGR